MNRTEALKRFSAYLEARRELENGLFLDESIIERLKRLGHDHSIQLETLEQYEKRISNCTKCSLHKTRKNFVFGDGDSHADLVFIGEAPGNEEDLSGIPFVGPAGRLLDDIFHAVGIDRKKVYICNVLKCHPPGNRDPFPQEVKLCEPYLWRQLELIKPRMIVALGKVAANTLLKNNASLGAMRNVSYKYRGIPLVVTYHPGWLLRNSSKRPLVEEDMRRIKAQFLALLKR